MTRSMFEKMGQTYAPTTMKRRTVPNVSLVTRTCVGFYYMKQSYNADKNDLATSSTLNKKRKDRNYRTSRSDGFPVFLVRRVLQNFGRDVQA